MIFSGADVNGLLDRNRREREDRAGVEMATTISTGRLQLTGPGEFRASLRFPHKFNSPPKVFFSWELQESFVLVPTQYPDFQAYVLSYNMAYTEHVTQLVVGCNIAGYVYAKIFDDQPNAAYTIFPGVVNWMAVGHAFGGAS